MTLDDLMELALLVPPADRERAVRLLCEGDAAQARDALRLLEAYAEAPVAWPPRDFPCQVGPFELVQPLGGGAHGTVYLARRPPLEGHVAVKIFAPAGPVEAFVDRIRREASAARRIASSDIVTVFDAGRLGSGLCYIEMEAVVDPDLSAPGGLTARTLAGAEVDEDVAARMVERLAGAVAAAHALGIVHGDVKPANVLWSRRGPDGFTVKLADFGVATSVDVAGVATSVDVASAAGDPDAGRRAHAGTPAYMAPEVWRDHRPAGESSDVYGLGGVLYELLTSHPPHPQRTQARAGAASEDPPVAPLPTSVPRRLREIVARALAPDPRRRYPSAAVLADELRRYREQRPTQADARRPDRVAGLWVRRHRGEVAVALAIALLVAPVAALQVRRLDRLREDIQRAQETLQDRQRDLRGALGELDDARRANETLKVQRDAKLKEIEGLELAVNRFRGALRELPVDVQKRIDATAVTFNTSLDELRREHDADLEALTACRTRAGDATHRLEQATTANADLVKARDQAVGAAEQLRLRVAELEARERTAAQNRETEIASRAAAAAADLAGKLSAVTAERDALRARLQGSPRGATPPSTAPAAPTPAG